MWMAEMSLERRLRAELDEWQSELTRVSGMADPPETREEWIRWVEGLIRAIGQMSTRIWKLESMLDQARPRWQAFLYNREDWSDPVRSSAQKQVVEAVEERGYRARWTRAQFVARQIAKLQEELGEAANCVNTGSGYAHRQLWFYQSAARDAARDVFDSIGAWDDADIFDRDALRGEVTDMQVVLFNIAEALEMDAVEEAVQKAKSDVERGVR